MEKATSHRSSSQRGFIVSKPETYFISTDELVSSIPYMGIHDERNREKS